MGKNLKDLSEQEILALAISSEETDARIYADFAAGLKKPITPQPPKSLRKWRQFASSRFYGLGPKDNFRHRRTTNASRSWLQNDTMDSDLR